VKITFTRPLLRTAPLLAEILDVVRVLATLTANHDGQLGPWAPSRPKDARHVVSSWGTTAADRRLNSLISC